MSNKIVGIIWDFGKVLASFDHLKACKKLACYCNIPPVLILERLFSGENAPAKLHELGRISSQQFYNEVLRLLPFSKDITFSEFSEIWKDIFRENRGISTLIGKVRSEIKQCICSNTDPIHWSAIEQLPVMKKYFSNPALLTRSYTSGARKPNVKIFLDALASLHMEEGDANHVLYIEDIAAYRQVFLVMGGNVLSYDCTVDKMIELKRRLYKYGVLE